MKQKAVKKKAALEKNEDWEDEVEMVDGTCGIPNLPEAIDDSEDEKEDYTIRKSDALIATGNAEEDF